MGVSIDMKKTDHVVETLLDENTIKSRIAELGKQISKDYKGRELLAVCILKGAVVFFADLIREIELPVKMEFMAVSSYGAETQSSGQVQIIKDLDQSCFGKDILIVEDIMDTGMTLKYLWDVLKAREPRSMKICTLLNKPSRRVANITPDYVGFEIPDAFVVGFGLDVAEKYRNLSYVAVVKPLETE